MSLTLPAAAAFGCRRTGVTGGSLQLSGDVLVGPRGGAGAVPGSSVWIGLWVGGIGECAVDPVAVVRSRGPVRGGADERVCELHAPSDGEQPGMRTLWLASRPDRPDGHSNRARSRSVRLIAITLL